MPSANVTVTAKTGPAIQALSLVLSNCDQFDFLVGQNILRVHQNGVSGFKDFDLNGVATVTVTISGSTYTVSLS